MDLGFPSDSAANGRTWRWWRRRRFLWTRQSTSTAGNLHGETHRQRQEPNGAARGQARSAIEITNRFMQFSFIVGAQEKHQVDFSFDQFIGNLEIRVDGQPAIKDFRMFSLSLTKRYEFIIGIN